MKLDRAMSFLCAGVVLTIAGLGIALLSAVILAQGYYIRQWPATDGVIVRSEVEATKKASGFRRSGVTVQSDYYVGKIEYQYTVDGLSHTGHEIGGGGGVGSFQRQIAQAEIEKYPVGQAVTVFYNPQRPEWAVIDRSFNFVLWWAACSFALIVGCSGVYCWLKAIRIDDARRAAERPAVAPPVPQPVVSGRPPRRMHWALRTAAVLLGLLFFFLGSLVTVHIASDVPRPGISRGVWITAILIPAMFALFGAFLIRSGIARPRLWPMTGN